MSRVWSGLNRAILVAVLLAGCLVLMGAPAAHAGATIVQHTNANIGSTPATSITFNFVGAVTSGDVVVFSVAADACCVPISASDSFGSSYSSVTATGSFPLGQDIFYATLGKSGTDMIKATFSNPDSHVAIYAFEVSGVTTAGATTRTGSGPNPSSSAATSSVTFQSGAFLFGVVFTDAIVITQGSGFTPTSFLQFSYGESAISGVSSPTTFPWTLGCGSSECDTAYAEAGIALNPSTPIPEYPMGLIILSVFMILAYTMIRRRTHILN